MAMGDKEVLALDTMTADGLAAWSVALGEPKWLTERRLAALTARAALERPTARDEAWRFTDPKLAGLDALALVGPGSASARIDALLAPPGSATPGDPTTLALAARVVAADGGVVATEVSEELRSLGVIVADLRTALRDYPELVERHLFRHLRETDHDWMLASHVAAFTHGVFVYVPQGVQVDLPIGLVQWRGQPGATVGHALVVVEADARLTLVQQYGSEELGEHAFHHSVTELSVGTGAKVEVLSLQEWSAGPLTHFGVQHAEVGDGASLRSVVVTLGGDVVRFSPETWLGAHAEADFLGAVFANEGQHFEHRATTHHARPDARSSLLYKAGLLGGSRNVFYGNILIHPGARGSDAGQTMRNLVLSPNASAEAVPFLEIENSDVKCMHAAATGRVDDLHLFYLQSRGIPANEAKRLVVFGFFGEVLQQVGLQAVRERLARSLERELAKEVQ